MCGGSVFNQSVLAYDAKGTKRWSTFFEGDLPAKVAAKEADPFAPMAEVRALVAKTLETLGAARVTGDAGIAVETFVELQYAEPTAEACATIVHAATDDWAKALSEWNGKRPKKKKAAAKVRPAAKPKRAPFEIGFAWKKASPEREAEAALFLHDVARAEKLDPAALEVVKHRVGKSAVLRLVPDSRRLSPEAFECFLERAAHLAPMADATWLVQAQGAKYFGHAQVD